ncbi:MAG: DUF58 domain-containing protein [Ruminococcus sp.]|nr:DUF58 domain-containing protein [Ruminococcus sp.]
MKDKKKKNNFSIKGNEFSGGLKSIAALAAVAYLLYIFTFYIDGEMGMILIAFMIFAPIVSVIMAVYAKDRIKISFNCDAYVKKHSTLKVTVTAEKTGFFPLAVVEVKLKASEVFEENDKIYRFSMTGEDKKTFTLEYKAQTGGNGEISVENIYSCGFLGFLKFKVNNVLQSASIGVIPEIPEIKTSSQFFRNIADVVLTSDEEEDNDTMMLFSSNTTPGYEHREYVAGDPLKRINWKLSTKKDKLMVRLDEAAASAQPMILFDLFRKNDSKPDMAIISEERLIQSVFGLLSALVRQGIACTFVYYGAGDEVISENIDNPDYPAQLLLKVLAVKVKTDRRINTDALDDSICACIIASTDFGEGISAITKNIESPDNVSLMGISAQQENLTNFPMWYLDGDNNFKMV